MSEFNDKVLRTAFGVASMRTFTGISYSNEIFGELQKLAKLNKIELCGNGKIEGNLPAQIVPYFEARYLMTNKLLHANNSVGTCIRQVLEIAAGLSVRGMLYAGGKSHNSYVEIDQPEMAALKKEIRKALGTRIAPGNWKVCEGDAFDLNSIWDAIKAFTPALPIAIVNEGFLVYQSHEQKAAYARNISNLLSNHGRRGGKESAWLTPDIAITGAIDYPGREKVEKKWHASVKRDLSKNYFATEEEARAFFEGLGFSVERHSLNEVRGELKSPEILGLSEETVQGVIAKSPYFVMRIKQ